MTGVVEPALITATDEWYLRQLVINEAGIDIGERRGPLLAARLGPVSKQHGLENLASLVRALRLGNDALQRDVIEAMTTNETSWFRDMSMFDGLMSAVIPPLVARLEADEPLTIWSAASSSGQEVYSVAVLLAEHFPALVQQQRVRLLATDLAPAMVDRCREGRYSALEMRRGMNEAHLESYFTRSGDGWVVGRKLRQMVFCRQLNLIGPLDAVPRCDLVLVRNVLIYFSADLKASILREIHRSVLKPDGALILGSTEAIGSAGEIYETHAGTGATFYTSRPVLDSRQRSVNPVR